MKPEERVLQNLNKAVLEHLELAGFTKVAKIFKDEMANGPTKPTVRARSGSRDKQKKDQKDNMQPQQLLLQIQSSFDKGNKQEFFKSFDALIPLEMKKKDF